MSHRVRHPLTVTLAGACALALAACGSGGGAASSGSSAQAPSGAADAPGTVTVTNCGEQASFPSPAKKMYVYDGGMIAMVLAIGAADSMGAVTGKATDAAALKQVYGDIVERLPETGAKYPTLEGVLAKRPDVVVAGYNYGYSESRNLMPQMLKDKGIAPYILSESCRPKAGEKQRGTMEPWLALRTDLENLGAITGHAEDAKRVNTDIDTRLAALRAAPKPAKSPTVLLFDSGKDGVFTSGKFGAPEGIIAAAGGKNVASDVADTWTQISWEKVATAKPDFITFVNYGEQTMADKVKMLEANPATRDLPAVKEKRYLNLPYAAWVSSPLNIDAAEGVRASLEKWKLAPASGIRPKNDLHIDG